MASLALLKSLYGCTDDVEHEVRMREHGHMAAVDWMCTGSHTFCQETLQIWVDSFVIVGHDVPTRFRLPGGACSLFVEKVGGRCVMRCSHELLVLLGKIPSEVLGAVRL